MSAREFMPAEACTELGADTAPARLGIVRRAVIAGLEQRRATVADERQRYEAAGAIGPVYHRNSLQQQLQLMREIRAVRSGAPLKRTPTTLVVAIVGAAVLAMGGCGGGGADEQPQPRPQVDCKAKPEQCK